jgi:hypothetical protein
VARVVLVHEAGERPRSPDADLRRKRGGAVTRGLAGASVIYGGLAVASWVVCGPAVFCVFAVPAVAAAIAAVWRRHRRRRHWTRAERAFLDGRGPLSPAAPGQKREPGLNRGGRHG